MDAPILDIRSATCKGGGCLWAFLSHVREIPPGGALELLTDDPIAGQDIPEWVKWEGWSLLAHENLEGYTRFVVRRPAEPGLAPGAALRGARQARVPSGVA